MKSKWLMWVGGVLLVLCCGLSFFAVFGAGTLFFMSSSTKVNSKFISTVQFGATSLPENSLNTQNQDVQVTPIPVQKLFSNSVDGGAVDTLNTLENEVVPISDLRDLSSRLKGLHNIPETVPSTIDNPQLGMQKKFWVSNVDNNNNFQVSARLRYAGEHVYFWVQEGVSFNQDDLDNLAKTFDQKIYPTDRQFFGSEWKPGIDEDPHLYILLASGLGGNLAGYFASVDEVPPQVHQYSNAHEMFLLNSDNIRLDEQFTYGVLAHEFQHMIHANQDRNEESWMNEGFSEVAAFLNKYEAGGFDTVYMSDPDLQLNDWPEDHNQTVPHYGAAFLYLTYFLDRFGEKATQQLVAEKRNGMDSIDYVLNQLSEINPKTGKTYTADEVFAEWTVANYLQDGKVEDGRFTYHNYPQAPQANDTEKVSTCPKDWQDRTVNQYGVDYIRIDCPGSFTLNIQGPSEVGVLPVDPHGGKYAYWSNKGDESDMTLTQTFDFSKVQGPIELSYWTWYNLEKDYDYTYLEASENGTDWKILKTPSGTDSNPSGNSYGWGYNGSSQVWELEKVDLSEFAGKKVQLRFEYVTDAAVNGEGFMLDDVAIPQIGYQTDFETDNGGWEQAGFVRIENQLPQKYNLSLIEVGKNTSVKNISFNGDQAVSVPIYIGGDVDHVVLVVSGTTRFTRQLANYRFQIQ